MPCFSNGPAPGTPAYDTWLPEVNAALDRFIHVVDYYYGRAGLPVPQPARPEDAGGFRSAEELALKAAVPIDPRENSRVLQQVLLHLDCDEVDMLDLHELRLLLQADSASRGHQYQAVLNYCFAAMHSGFRARPTNLAQWRACQDIGLMLDALEGSASDRKLRLFAVACCRRVPHAVEDPRCRRAVDVAERFADGRAGRTELEAAEQEAANVTADQSADSLAAGTASAQADEAARMTALGAAFESGVGREDERTAQADLLRCIWGNPFRPVTVPSEWRTSTAVALAQRMYDLADFTELAILADALQDAGCNSEDILNHCRVPGAHVRGCWVVDLILGKS